MGDVSGSIGTHHHEVALIVACPFAGSDRAEFDPPW